MAEDHNIWNYLYFMYYLQNKDFTELTGVESRVKSMMNREDSNWIPLLRTGVISEENQTERVEQNIDVLLDAVQKINQKLRRGISLKSMQSYE